MAITQDSIQIEQSSSETLDFREKIVHIIEDKFSALCTNIGKPLPFLGNLIIKNQAFIGKVIYNAPEDTFFITSNQLISNVYKGEILRTELRLTSGEYNAMKYSNNTPNLETTVRIMALSAHRPSEAKGVNQLVTVDMLIHRFNEIFPTLNITQMGKTGIVSRNTLYSVLDGEQTGKLSLISFLKVLQAACATYNQEENTVWENLTRV